MKNLIILLILLLGSKVFATDVISLIGEEKRVIALREALRGYAHAENKDVVFRALKKRGGYTYPGDPRKGESVKIFKNGKYSGRIQMSPKVLGRVLYALRETSDVPSFEVIELFKNTTLIPCNKTPESCLCNEQLSIAKGSVDGCKTKQSAIVRNYINTSSSLNNSSCSPCNELRSLKKQLSKIEKNQDIIVENQMTQEEIDQCRFEAKIEIDEVLRKYHSSGIFEFGITKKSTQRELAQIKNQYPCVTKDLFVKRANKLLKDAPELLNLIVSTYGSIRAHQTYRYSRNYTRSNSRERPRYAPVGPGGGNQNPPGGPGYGQAFSFKSIKAKKLKNLNYYN